MTIREIVEKLQALPNQDEEVLVLVKTATQVYPQAYVTPFQVQQGHDGGRIYITLPDGMYVGKRKAA